MALFEDTIIFFFRKNFNSYYISKKSLGL